VNFSSASKRSVRNAVRSHAFSTPSFSQRPTSLAITSMKSTGSSIARATLTGLARRGRMTAYDARMPMQNTVVMGHLGFSTKLWHMAVCSACEPPTAM
jgi:hypothetical protein